MFSSIFIVGSLAFYLLLVVASALFVCCDEYDDFPGFTVASVIGVFLALFLLGNLGSLVVAHPLKTILAPIVWIAIGMLWSFPRWIIFLKRALVDYTKQHAEYMSGIESDYDDKGNRSRHPATEKGWIEGGSSGVCSRYGMMWKDNKIQPPAFARNRQRLMAWVVLWPWSVLWTFTREIIIDGVRHIVNMFGGTYQRLSNWIFSKVS